MYKVYHKFLFFSTVLVVEKNIDNGKIVWYNINNLFRGFIMRKLCLLLCILLLSATICMACGGDNSSSSYNSSVDSIAIDSENNSEDSVGTQESIDSVDSMENSETSAEEAQTYSIIYIGIKEYDKSVMDIPAKMMPSTKSYPQFYMVGEAMVIDRLQYAVVFSTEYEFVNYYSDANCTQLFAGIDENTTGEITVYALIRVHLGTPNV